MSNILVCVTQQKHCERLIKAGAERIQDENDELYVLHVSKKGFNFLNQEDDGEALEFLYHKAKEFGANLTVVRSDDVLSVVLKTINRNDIAYVILGVSDQNNKKNDFTETLKESMPSGVVLEVIGN